jgi:hypothetical protein
MTRPFRQEPIPIEQLINAELKDEALQYKENPTLELYRMTLDRSRASEQQSEEVLYIGDQRLAVVTWGGRALVCDDVDSAEHAFEQILRDLEPAYGGRRSPIVQLPEGLLERTFRTPLEALDSILVIF